MDDFDRYLNEQMKDPDFKKEWDANEARYQLMMMVLRARNEAHLTQSELAERTGLRQSRETLIQSLFDFTLVFSCSARNNSR